VHNTPGEGRRLKKWTCPSCGRTRATAFCPSCGEEPLRPRDLTVRDMSGQVLRQFRNKPWYGPETTLVCYDDIDLPLGQLRLRFKGSAGGHRGMLSVIEHLGSDAVPRLRVGVGPVPPNDDAAEFVLARFSPEERKVLDDGMEKAGDAVALSLEKDFETAMNRYNSRAKA